MLVNTALSSRNTSRSGAIPPTPAVGSLCQFARACTISSRSCSAGWMLRFFHVQPPQRSPDGPGIDPHAGLLGQAIAAFRQRQVIVRLQQAAQHRLNLVADDRLRGATYPLRRTATFIARRRYPAIDRRAANQKPLGHRISRLTGFNRHKHTFTQVCRIGSRQSTPPPRYIGMDVPTYMRLAVSLGAAGAAAVCVGLAAAGALGRLARILAGAAVGRSGLRMGTVAFLVDVGFVARAISFTSSH